MTDYDLNDSYPYLAEANANESNGHLHLKNVAVQWLLQRGFQIEDVDIEYPIQRPGEGRGDAYYTDVYASSGAQEAFVECETNFTASPNQLSGGGMHPAKNGKPVYVVSDEAIYLVKSVEREFTPTMTATDGETRTKDVIEFDAIAAPPMLPV